MQKEKRGAERGEDSKDPRANYEVWFDGHRPRRCREDQQKDQAKPLEGATGLGVHMRLAIADRADPAFPETNR